MFGKKTVDGVLSVFHKAISDLEEVQTESMQEASRKRDEAARLEAESIQALGEANRATTAITQIKRIVGLEQDPADDKGAPIRDLHVGRY